MPSLSAAGQNKTALARGPDGWPRFRWGFLGTGTVADRFAAQLATLGNAELAGVASHTPGRAEAWAATHGAKASFRSYRSLLDDDEIDIVYVATPAEQHHEHCIAALQAGKGVLCEKPFAMTAAEARTIAEAAQQEGRFCMEAMWLRFSVLVQRVRSEVRAGGLGAVSEFRAELGYRTAEVRLRDGQASRGALLNFGVYGVSLAHFLFGSPSAVRAAMVPHPSGLDASVAAVLCYPTCLATISASVSVALSNEAFIAGDTGSLRLGPPFFNPGWLRRVSGGAAPARPAGPGRMQRLASFVPGSGLLQGSFAIALLRGNALLALRPRAADGMRLEAAEVIRCLAAGETESPVMPLAESIAVLETLDEIRRVWG